MAGKAAAIGTMHTSARLTIGGIVPPKQVRIVCPMCAVTGDAGDDGVARVVKHGLLYPADSGLVTRYGRHNAVSSWGPKSAWISQILGVARRARKVEIRRMAQPWRYEGRVTIGPKVSCPAVEVTVALSAEVADGRNVLVGIRGSVYAHVLVMELIRGPVLPSIPIAIHLNTQDAVEESIAQSRRGPSNTARIVCMVGT